MSISTIRHDEIFPVNTNNVPITVIGVGAIGSRVGMALIELGLTKLTFIDFDRVELHNLANQAFCSSHVGVSKVTAMEDLVRMKVGYVPASMTFINTKLTPESESMNHGTVFMCVDSIEARKMLVEKFAKDGGVFHIFDTRMASTHGDIFYLNPNDPDAVRKYISALPDNEETEVSACGTSLTVGTTASIIANLAVWQFMHQRTNTAAMDKTINIFLKPLCISTGDN